MLKPETLVHISLLVEAVKALARRLAEEETSGSRRGSGTVASRRMAVDIAMFGRMLAKKLILT